ncbi:hypothetical protein Tco_0862528 [Tanacetum coccineum]
MGDENHIRTLGDYSKPSHEGYRITIELLVGNNVVPLRSDTIRLVQNGCSFHGLRSKDPNQHLKDFLKLDLSHKEDLTTLSCSILSIRKGPAKDLHDILIFHNIMRIAINARLVPRTTSEKSLIMVLTYGFKFKSSTIIPTAPPKWALTTQQWEA